MELSMNRNDLEPSLKNQLEQSFQQPISSDVPHIPVHELLIGRLLGGGAFCDVYSASLVSNCQTIASNYDDLATKTVRRTLDEDQLEVAALDIANEVHILTTLSHPNIIRLQGVCQIDGVIKHVVLDRLNDTLSYRLKAWRQESKRCSAKFLLRDRLRDVALGIASGLEYLHNQGVVHRDLKPQNIGFDDFDNPVLFDFGLARRIEPTADNGTLDLYPAMRFHESYSSMTTDSSASAHDSCDDCFDEALAQSMTVTDNSGPAGTPRYMAPEIARGESYSVAADVYSFAIILWELVTLKKAFQKYTTVTKLHRKVVNGKDRPSAKAVSSRNLRNLMMSCWIDTSDMRPPMLWVKLRLEHVINELESSPAPRKGGLTRIPSSMLNAEKPASAHGRMRRRGSARF